MKREKLKLLMALLVLAAAWILSREGTMLVSQMHVLNPGKTGEFCVVIDPGHGGDDPGKVSDDGILEKDVNLAIALRLKDLLEAQGVCVRMTRDSDEGLYNSGSSEKKTEDLRNRCEMINRLQPDCVVSVHQNSYHKSGVDGAQTFYYTTSAEGKELAEVIQSRMVSGLDPTNHRVAKANDSYYLLKKTSKPIVIVECGFLSNPQEAQLLCDEVYQERVAWQVHMGVLQYLYGQAR